MNYWTSMEDQIFEYSVQSLLDLIDKSEIGEDKAENITIDKGLIYGELDLENFLDNKENNHNKNDEELVIDKSTQNKSSRLKKNLFKISRSSQDKLNDATEFISKKRRGRHILNESNSEKEEQKFHDQNSWDNILRKVQVRVLNYIIAYANAILKEFNYEDKFLNLHYDFKNNVNKECFESLKNSTLSGIVCNNISEKYKTKDINTNKILYEKIRENCLLKKIFDEKFLVLFECYYKNKKRISLKKYGSKQEICLPEEVKTYRDLTLKYSNNEEYLKNINNCICHNYFKDYKFWMIEN